MKTHNFYAGPAVLDQSVIKKSAEALINFEGTGLSILELSHRSKEIVTVMDRSVALVKELLSIPEGYEVLFLTGGASSQFYYTAMNVLGESEKAAYVDTGTWSAKAIKEANHFGQIDVVASSKDKNYTFIPKELNLSGPYKYMHITSNNTVYGTQYQAFPDLGIPLVADMSSDILSRKIDVSKFDIIYAGAQKNLGPAGVTLVIVKSDILGKISRDIPTMLDYRTHIAKNSSFNTPPVFPIYVSMLSLEWLHDLGGVDFMEQRNIAKAEKLYNAIDESSLFKGIVNKEDRSLMNAVFAINDESLSDSFISFASKHHCVGIKGHRSVGGFRASIYNALAPQSVDVLIDVMKEFEQKHA